MSACEPEKSVYCLFMLKKKRLKSLINLNSAYVYIELGRLRNILCHPEDANRIEKKESSVDFPMLAVQGAVTRRLAIIFLCQLVHAKGYGRICHF